MADADKNGISERHAIEQLGVGRLMERSLHAAKPPSSVAAITARTAAPPPPPTARPTGVPAMKGVARPAMPSPRP